MAHTSYLARAIYKEIEAGADIKSVDYAGTYKLVCAMQSMGAPVEAPNTVESTTNEDDSQTFEMGIKQSSAIEIKGNLEKEYLDNLDGLGNKRVAIMQLYGTDGIGGVAKYAYVGQISATPSEVGGTDEILAMDVTIVKNTTSKKVTDDYTIVDNGDGTFTVTKKS